MDRWNRTLLACSRVVDELPPQAVQTGWLGFPAATDEEIRRAEALLGAMLPPSYRQFLRTTNGWRTVGDHAVRPGRLWSSEEVGWYRDREMVGINAWLAGAWPGGRRRVVPDEDYFVYGDGQLPETMRDEYLLTALQVSAEGVGGGGVYLLNPQIVTPSGEWEAWFFAAWIPGAIRYRSFWDLMEGELGLFVC